MTADPIRTWLMRLSLGAGIAFTATAEYDLARALGANPVIAAMLPLAIDAYVVAALRWFKAFDIVLSLMLMGAAQVGAHLIDSHVMQVNIPLVVVVSLLVPVALWRTHALARVDTHDVPECVEYEAPVQVERAPESHPELPSADAPEVHEYAKPVLAESTRPRNRRVSASVPDTSVPDSELVKRARKDFGDRVPPYSELKSKYRIGQERARRIRQALEGGQV